MSLVPAGFVPKLVYQKRMLGDDEGVGSIGYSPDRSISLVCVRATPAWTAAHPELHSVSSRPTESNPSAATHQTPASLAAVSAGMHATHVATDVVAPSPSHPAVCSHTASAAVAAASSIESSTHTSFVAQSAAETSAPAALTVQYGSRVRIKGLQSTPEMNGRTGMVCGAFNQELGRWAVEVDADGARRACRGTFRPGNLRVIPSHILATEWLDEHDCVCPKAVDYFTQCPKGHALVAFADAGGGASAQRVICRVCHVFAERGHATQWLACSVTGCCTGYAVCDSCISALQPAPAAAVVGEGFSMLVKRTTAAAVSCFCSHSLL